MAVVGAEPVLELTATFLRNMAQLWRVDSQLAREIDAVEDEERPAVRPTKSGHWTAEAPATDGRPCLLHSRYDPAADAGALAESVDTADKFCFIVCGFGLGYHVAALYERLKGDAFIIVCEPNLRLLAAGLSCVDLSEALGRRRLVFLTNTRKEDVHRKLAPHNAVMMLGTRFVEHPPSRRTALDFHATMRQLITDYISYTKMGLVTLVANSQITCRNVACNLPAYVSTPPIDILRGRFTGRPGIVVSAGPSLRRNIDLLNEAKGRAVICAAQTTLRPLLARGIVPDYVTSLDYHEISRQFFEGIGEQCRRVHLVAEPKATWHVIDGYSGPVSLLDNAFAHLLIGDGLAARGALKAGATVAHLAFYLLVYMGCDPVIFVGQDLAFTGHVFYVPGVEIHRTWRGEINRFNTMEVKEWERIVRNRPVLRKVSGWEGQQLYADDLLLTYLEQFEKDFAGVNVRVIDATEGGAGKRGADAMSLRDAISRFCADPIPPLKFDYLDDAARRDLARLRPAADELRDRLKEVDRLRDVCAEMIELLVELEGMVDQPARFNARLARVDELRAVLRQSDRAYRIVNAVSQLAELQRFAADRRLDAADHAGSERARRQLARDRHFVMSMKEAADATREILGQSLRRFADAMEKGVPGERPCA